MADYTFNKITSTHDRDGFTYTISDYIAADHVMAYVLDQNKNGWVVTAVEPDDRPADADRTYNPPAHIL